MSDGLGIIIILLGCIILLLQFYALKNLKDTQENKTFVFSTSLFFLTKASRCNEKGKLALYWIKKLTFVSFFWVLFGLHWCFISPYRKLL